MPSRRIERLNEQLKREIASLLRTRVRDPRLQRVTVTAVRAAPDLTFARVLVRMPVDEESVRREGLEGLEAAAPFLRRALGQELQIRRVPELDFQVDTTLERAARIEEILNEVRPDEGWDSEPEGGEPE